MENYYNSRELRIYGLVARTKKTGSAIWMELPGSALSSYGKEVVSSDPDLSQDTLAALKEDYLSNINYTKSERELDFSPGTTGCTMLSSCIKDNSKATLAELVARYAGLTSRAFYPVAKALSDYLQENQHFIVYSFQHDTFDVSKWTPQRLDIIHPPTKKQKGAH